MNGLNAIELGFELSVAVFELRFKPRRPMIALAAIGGKRLRFSAAGAMGMSVLSLLPYTLKR